MKSLVQAWSTASRPWLARRPTGQCGDAPGRWLTTAAANQPWLVTPAALLLRNCLRVGLRKSDCLQRVYYSVNWRLSLHSKSSRNTAKQSSFRQLKSRFEIGVVVVVIRVCSRQYYWRISAATLVQITSVAFVGHFNCLTGDLTGAWTSVKFNWGLTLG